MMDNEPREVLPDGTEADFDDEYCNAWREYARLICEAVGAELYAFDPSISIIRRSPRGGPDDIVDLPRWFVDAFNAGEIGEQDECSADQGKRL